jgi:hypothetical protein
VIRRAKRAKRSKWLRCALLAALLGGCDPTSFGPAPATTDTSALPGSSVVAPPLEDPRADGGLLGSRERDGGDDGGDSTPVPPEPLDPDEPLPPDEPLGVPGGARLDMVFRWRGVPAPPALSEVDTKAVERLRRAASGAVQVVLGAGGRLRVDVVSRGFALPEATSLIARADRYGHILIWPDEARYRVVPVGAVRAIFGESRADVGQVVRGAPTMLPAGDRLGMATRRVELSSPMGTAVIELAEIPAAGVGAGLFCRFVLDLAGIDPASEVCRSGEVVVSAELRWLRGGPGLVIEATALTIVDALSHADMAMPPRRARFARSGLPERPPVFFAADELATLRTTSIDVGPLPSGAPERGLEALNRSDLTMFLLVDGIPIALVPPWQTISIGGLRPGRYILQWRSFLGDVVGAASEEIVPGRAIHGEPLPEPDRDAG